MYPENKTTNDNLLILLCTEQILKQVLGAKRRGGVSSSRGSLKGNLNLSTGK